MGVGVRKRVSEQERLHAILRILSGGMPLKGFYSGNMCEMLQGEKITPQWVELKVRVGVGSWGRRVK